MKTFMARFPAVLAIAALLTLTGCPPIEQNARDTAATAQGFINQAQQDHLAECQANPTKAWPCAYINQAIGAQNLLIDAIEQYCGWPSRPGADALKQYAGQACVANKGALQHLQSSISSINSIMADYKQAAAANPPPAGGAK